MAVEEEEADTVVAWAAAEEVSDISQEEVLKIVLQGMEGAMMLEMMEAMVEETRVAAEGADIRSRCVRPQASDGIVVQSQRQIELTLCPYVVVFYWFQNRISGSTVQVSNVFLSAPRPQVLFRVSSVHVTPVTLVDVCLPSSKSLAVLCSPHFHPLINVQASPKSSFTLFPILYRLNV